MGDRVWVYILVEEYENTHGQGAVGVKIENSNFVITLSDSLSSNLGKNYILLKRYTE